MPVDPLPARLAATGLLIATGLALSACELRRDGDAAQDPAPEQTEGPAQPATPAASPGPTGASIIREEIAEAPATPEPPEPLKVALPFPDGTDISPNAEELLELVMQSDAMRQGWPITLGGHTDSAGNDQANLRASRSRAENVAAWMIERGIADDRITVIAFGEQNPLAPNARPDGSPDEVARRRNRRVEVTIAPPAPAAAPTRRPSGTNEEP